MLNDILAGAGYMRRGWSLIREPGLRRYVIAPIAVNCLVIVGLVWLFSSYWGGWLDGWMAGLPDWLAWLEAVVWWLGMIAVLAVFALTFTVLANLIASPFNGLLAAQVEKRLTGQLPESGQSLWSETVSGLTGEGRKLFYFAWRAILLLLLSLVLIPFPLLNTAIPVLWFALSAFMLALEYLDNPMSNHGMSFPAKLASLRRRRGLGLGFGAVATVLTTLPLVNLVVMPVAVAGATALWVDRLRESARPGH
jgi:CysZ protein